MKLFKLLSLLVILSIVSCNTNKKNKQLTQLSNEEHLENEGLKLLKQHCYACHSVVSPSHDAIIAPPMVAVKRRYKMSYKNESDFVNAFTNWILNPKEEKALMRGAVMNFNVMPKQPFEKNDIVKIATYVYNNELEKPQWFDKHFTEEHPNGMGNGLGKGRGRIRNLN